MKYLWIVILSLLITACATTQAQELGASEGIIEEPEIVVVQEQNPTDTPLPPPSPSANLPDLGEAPELVNEVWLNTDQPLRLASLRGNVVLLDMWTFG